jgi:hypothetical protein
VATTTPKMYGEQCFSSDGATFQHVQLFKLGAESLLKGAALEQQSGSNDTAVLQQ